MRALEYASWGAARYVFSPDVHVSLMGIWLVFRFLRAGSRLVAGLVALLAAGLALAAAGLALAAAGLALAAAGLAAGLAAAGLALGLGVAVTGLNWPCT